MPVLTLAQGRRLRERENGSERERADESRAPRGRDKAAGQGANRAGPGKSAKAKNPGSPCGVGTFRVHCSGGLGCWKFRRSVPCIEKNGGSGN